MSSPEVGVVGLREFIRDLERAGADVADIKAEMNAAGNIVVAEAQARAPHVSGALAGSIRASKAKGSVTIKSGSARVPYAAVIHWGWPARNIAPNNYLTDAAAAKQDEVVQAVADGLARLLRQNHL